MGSEAAATRLSERSSHRSPDLQVMNHSFVSPASVGILSRLFAAVLGGYGLASALAVFLATAWPAVRAEAVLTGVLWSFALHVLAVIWSFSPLSLGRVWLGLLVPTVVLAAASAWLAWGR